MWPQVAVVKQTYSTGIIADAQPLRLVTLVAKDGMEPTWARSE